MQVTTLQRNQNELLDLIGKYKLTRGTEARVEDGYDDKHEQLAIHNLK